MAAVHTDDTRDLKRKGWLSFFHTFNAAHLLCPFRKFVDSSEMWTAIQLDGEFFGQLGAAFVEEQILEKPRDRKVMLSILREFDDKLYLATPPADDTTLSERHESKENSWAIAASLPQCKPHNAPGNSGLSKHFFYIHPLFDLSIAVYPFFNEGLPEAFRDDWTPKKFAESVVKIGKGTCGVSGSDRLSQRGHMIKNFNKDKEMARSLGVDLSPALLYVDYGESDLDARRHCAADSIMLGSNSKFKALQAVRAEPDVMKRLVAIYPHIKLEANCAASEVFILPGRLRSMRNESRSQVVSNKPYTEAEMMEHFGDKNNMHAYYLERTPEIVEAFKNGIEAYVTHLEFTAFAAQLAADIQKTKEQAERDYQQIIEAAKSKRDAALSEVHVKENKLAKLKMDKHKVPPFLTASALEQAPTGLRQYLVDPSAPLSPSSRIGEQKTIDEFYY
jgi:hypothetical protein